MPKINLKETNNDKPSPRPFPVFCGFCKFGKTKHAYDTFISLCEYPANVYWEKKYDAVYEQYKQSPSEININNNCWWYVDKNIFIRIIHFIKNSKKGYKK